MSHHTASGLDRRVLPPLPRPHWPSLLWDRSQCRGLSVPGSHAVPAQNRRRGEGGVRPQLEMQYLRPVGCRLPPSLLSNCQSQVSRPSLGLGLPPSSLQSRSHLTDRSNLKQLSASSPQSPLHSADLSRLYALKRVFSPGQSPPPIPSPPPPRPDPDVWRWSVISSLQASWAWSPGSHLRTRSGVPSPECWILKCKWVHQLGLNKPHRWENSSSLKVEDETLQQCSPVLEINIPQHSVQTVESWDFNSEGWRVAGEDICISGRNAVLERNYFRPLFVSCSFVWTVI